MIQDLITYILIGAALVYVFYQAFRILGRQSQSDSSGCGGCSGCAPHSDLQDSANPGSGKVCKSDFAVSEK